MKIAVKVTLIISALLIVAGLAITVTAFAMAGWDINKMSNENFITNEHIVTEDFEKISINVKNADIIILPSDNTETKIIAFEKENMIHKAQAENGVLSISLQDTRKWYEYISISPLKSPKITVYLPKSEYSSLIIKSDTGDVSVDEAFAFDSCIVNIDTGDTHFKATTNTTLKIESDTGDITLGGAHKGNVELDTDTGDIDIKALCEGARISAETNTGEIEISNLSCASLSIESDSGDVELKSVIATEKMQIETDTGDVELSGCDAYEISIVTDTGDVEGSILTPKHFIVKSDTGRPSYPTEMTSEQKCRITTDTGDIKIRVQ